MLRANQRSRAHTGTTVYPTDLSRGVFFVVASTELQCSVGGGDPFPIPAGGHWAPVVVPTSSIQIIGDCIVVSDTVPA